MTQPQEAQHHQVKPNPDPHYEVGPPPPIKLADEIGTQEGQRIGQDPDRQRQRADLYKPGDPQNVQHGHGGQEDAGQHEKDPFATLSNRGRHVDILDVRYVHHR